MLSIDSPAHRTRRRRILPPPDSAESAAYWTPHPPRSGLPTHREVRAGELAQGPPFEPGGVRRSKRRHGRERLGGGCVLAVDVVGRPLEVKVGRGVVLELSLEPAQHGVPLRDIVDLQSGTRIDL